MALTLAATISDARAAEALRLLLGDDQRPPFDCGSVDKAPADIVASMCARPRVHHPRRTGSMRRALPDS
jgi:hypothetical protein